MNVEELKEQLEEIRKRIEKLEAKEKERADLVGESDAKRHFLQES